MNIIIKLLILFCVIFSLGTLLTLKLYNFNFTKFRNSELYKKIILWIPIFLAFLLIVYSNNFIQMLSLALLLFIIWIEYLRVNFTKKTNMIFLLYIILLSASLLLLGFLHYLDANILVVLLALGFGTALSDVTGFFFGKFLGKHKLPAAINPQKSWEGVIGQVFGAFLGVLLLKIFVTNDINILLFIPIGVGSALGDLLNSFIKRKADIKNWSNFLPGHGGFIDRFSSLGGSALLTFYFLLLIK